MITPRTPDPDLSVGGDFLPNLASFGRRLLAENRSPSTVTTCGKAVGQLATYVAAAGMPTRVADVRREHVEAFLVDHQERGHKPATVSQPFR